MEVNWKQTGMKIRKIMKQKDYSMKRIANELYISESTMKNYIYAETKIPIDILDDMKRIFGFEKMEDLLVFDQETRMHSVREED